MRFLIDTHSFLWYITDDSRLTQQAADTISHPDAEIFLSIGSLWEIAIKHGLGKLDLPQPFDIFIRDQLRINSLQVLPITLAHLNQYTRLPLHHRDPFDRLLVAQTLAERLPLVTRDTVLGKYPIHVVW